MANRWNVPTGTPPYGTGHYETHARIGAMAESVEAELAGPVLGDWAGFGGYFARMPLREQEPVIWVTAGSSTTSSAALPEADRYPQKVTTTLQAQFPSSVSPTVRTLAQAVSSAPSGPGLHTINAGVSGTRSDDFLTATTRAQIVALNPHVISFMIGSNDYGNGVPVATYKANLIAQLDDFTARGYRRGFVLFHSYARYDAAATANKAAEWPAYLAALREIAATRSDVTVIDLSREFAAVSIPGSDVEGFMNTDLIHLVAKGQTWLAWAIARRLLGAMPTAALLPPGNTRTLVTTETASGAATGTLSGRNTDAVNGGSPVAWQSSGFGSWGIDANGRIARTSSGTEYVGIPAAANLEFETHIPVLASHSGTTLNSIDIRRAGTATGSDCVRIRHRADGSITLTEIVGGTETGTAIASAAAGTLAAGARKRIVANGTTVTVYLGGTQVLSGTVSVTASGLAGFAKSSTITAIAYDNIALYSIG